MWSTSSSIPSYEGFKGVVDYSATTHGDGGDYHGGAAYGFSFAEGRGHFVIGGEAEKSNSIGICSQGAGLVQPENTACTPIPIMQHARQRPDTGSRTF